MVDRLADLNRRLTEAEAERIGLEAHVRLIRKRDYDSLPAVIGSGLVSALRHSSLCCRASMRIFPPSLRKVIRASPR